MANSVSPGSHQVLAEADVVRHDAIAEGDRDDHLVDLRAVLRAALEDLDEGPVESEGGSAHVDLELELGVFASTPADVEEAGHLVVAVVDPEAQCGLEAVPDAADQDRVADEVILTWLIDAVGHSPSRSLAVQVDAPGGGEIRTSNVVNPGDERLGGGGRGSRL